MPHTLKAVLLYIASNLHVMGKCENYTETYTG